LASGIWREQWNNSIANEWCRRPGDCDGSKRIETSVLMEMCQRQRESAAGVEPTLGRAYAEAIPVLTPLSRYERQMERSLQEAQKFPSPGKNRTEDEGRYRSATSKTRGTSKTRETPSCGRLSSTTDFYKTNPIAEPILVLTPLSQQDARRARGPTSQPLCFSIMTVVDSLVSPPGVVDLKLPVHLPVTRRPRAGEFQSVWGPGKGPASRRRISKRRSPKSCKSHRSTRSILKDRAYNDVRRLLGPRSRTFIIDRPA
jgi:hypothetical protein